MSDTGLIITGVVSGVLLLGLAYYYFGRSTYVPFTSRLVSFLTYAGIVVLLAFGIYFIYQGVLGDQTSSGNLSSTPTSSNDPKVIPGGVVPPSGGSGGGNYGIQWWMYIQDWDTRYGQEKPVIKRGDNPYVFLHPTENSLCVKIGIFSRNSGDTMESAPASADGDGSAVDDSYTCIVKNVPLQTWFCVSLSVSGRNVDIYKDGLLVRSCLLPGVPKTAQGNLEIMPGGGFSGNVIDLYHFSRALKPIDAQSFCAKGTSGVNYQAMPSKPLFGYSVKFGLVDKSGKQIKEYTF
ncbi:MAG: hypothetical protein EBT86_03620 [Actinobacteria bacterium]|nr:hypothetical protein [Actinomycetota bacterium]